MKKLNKKLSELKAKETYLHSNLEFISSSPKYEYFNSDFTEIKSELTVIKEQIRTLLEARSILEN